MMHFDPVPEPADFDEEVRQPGREWLQRHPVEPKRPKDLWSKYKFYLADGFGNLCGYAVMFEPIGTVDHYLGCENYRQHVYEWDNYRFVSAWINSSKSDIDDRALDPYEVTDGWFEIILPSMQLVINEANIPPNEQARAEFTLQRLHLRDDERVIRQRREWYRMYENGELTLEGLERKAPLIARAIRRQLGNPN